MWITIDEQPLHCTSLANLRLAKNALYLAMLLEALNPNLAAQLSLWSSRLTKTTRAPESISPEPSSMPNEFHWQLYFKDCGEFCLWWILLQGLQLPTLSWRPLICKWNQIHLTPLLIASIFSKHLAFEAPAWEGNLLARVYCGPRNIASTFLKW